LIDESGEGGGFGRCMRLCGEPPVEVGFSFAERFEAVTVAADAVLEEIAREATACRRRVSDGKRCDR
jgi:hypothetical protein